MEYSSSVAKTLFHYLEIFLIAFFGFQHLTGSLSPHCSWLVLEQHLSESVFLATKENNFTFSPRMKPATDFEQCFDPFFALHRQFFSS